MTDIDIAQLLEDKGRPELADAFRTGQLADQPEPTPAPPVVHEGEQLAARALATYPPAAAASSAG